MGWNHFKSKLLVRYILSYLLILLVPLTIMTVIIYYNAVNSLQVEIEQSSISQLDQAKQHIDSRMQELEKIAIQVSLDSKLTPYMVSHQYYGKEAIEALEKYMVNSSIIDEMFLYFHNQDVVYSSRGKVAVDVMLDYTYNFADWDRDSFIYDMSNLTSSSFRPTEQVVMKRAKESRVLAYLEPLPVGQSNKHATIMFIIEETVLKRIMESVLNNFQGSAYIFDRDGNVLAAANHRQEVSQAEIAKLMDSEPGIMNAKWNNVEQSIVTVVSAHNGWKYVTALPSKQFLSRIVEIQSIIIMIFIITLIVGSVLAVQLARKQYHPIRDLLEITKLKSKSRSGSLAASSLRGHTELDQIKETLLSYRTQVDWQEPYARNQYLFNILKRGLANREEERHMLETMDIDLYERKLFVILTVWEEERADLSSVKQWEQLTNYLTELGLREGETIVYGVELSTINRLALIVAMKDSANLETQMTLVVEHLYGLIETRFDMVPTMGVGGLYEQPEQLNQSYIEAASALDTIIVNGQGSITYFSSLTEQSDTGDWIPKERLIKLEQSLKQGNAAVAVDTIELIFAELYRKEWNTALLRFMCYDVLNVMMKTALELNLSDLIQQYTVHTEFDTLNHLELKLCTLAVSICGQVEEQEEHEMKSLTDEVVAYINRHYCHYDLSLEKLSEKFRVSVSYLSRTIKENTGYTFSQHVWTLRMEEVKRQLVSSDEPLKEIISRVGYVDVPNFIRKFKKELGYTPGQYRKLHL